MADRISGKIAAILSTKMVVINRGETHGVKKGMKFEVQLPIPKIVDPDDPTNILEGLYYIKGTITVDEPWEKMSSCSVLTGSAAQAITTTTTLDLSYIETKPSHFINAEDWVIKVGDHVIEVTDTEKEKQSANLK